MYVMLCYGMTNEILIICYEILYYGMKFKCYAMVYAVNDMLELTSCVLKIDKYLFYYISYLT